MNSTTGWSMFGQARHELLEALCRFGAQAYARNKSSVVYYLAYWDTDVEKKNR